MVELTGRLLGEEEEQEIEKDLEDGEIVCIGGREIRHRRVKQV